VWTGVNAFWIVPEIAGLRVAVGSGDVESFQRTSAQFLEGQSLYTPLTNVLRLLGDWTWYQGLVDPYRSFAAFFTNSPIFTALGWMLVGLVALGALFGRGTGRAFFVFLALAGIVLGAGLNAPWAGIYRWAVEHIPGFWLVRSPWFKFTLFTVIGYSVLLGLAAPVVARLLARLLARSLPRASNRLRGATSALAVAAVAVLVGPVLAYPFTLGLSFATADERTFLNPNHASPPAYAYAAASWLNAQPEIFRVLTIPGDAPWLSAWGYAGFGSFLQTLTPKPVLFKRTPDGVKVSQGAADLSGALVEQLDADLLDQESESVAALAGRLGVGAIVHETDVRYDFYKGQGFRVDDSPQYVASILAARRGIRPTARIGAWDIYRIDQARPRFWAAPGVVAVQGLNARRTSRLLGSGWVDDTPLVDVSAPPATRALATVRVASSDRAPTPFDLWMADTASAAESLELQSDSALVIALGDPDDWGAQEALTPSRQWRWIKTPNGRHFVITNRSDDPKAAELQLQVLSYRRERSFYVYLNDELVSLETLGPDRPARIRIPNLLLRTGENVVSFYTPYQADERNGENVAFAVDLRPQIGRSAFAWRASLPALGEYRLLVMTEPLTDAALPQGLPARLALSVDGQVRLLPRREGSLATYEGTLRLGPGSTLGLVQQGQEHYVLLLRDAATKLPNAADVELHVLASSPTGYRLAVEARSPFVLVFNESHHEDWQARIDGAPLEHFKVDGYANGYWVDRAGEFEVSIEFAPQRAFEIAFAASASVVAISALSLAVLRVRRRAG
jgi:hypothetical protein